MTAVETIRHAVNAWRISNDPAEPHGEGMEDRIVRELEAAGLLLNPNLPRPSSKRAREWAKDMPARLVHAAALALTDNTPSDAHADGGARKAVAAVLRELTRADCPRTITALDIRFWANEAERTGQ
jgi:hypothetical protein